MHNKIAFFNFQMLHALGLLHEHQRPDRDDYIIVDMVAAARYKSLPQQLKKASFHWLYHNDYVLVSLI